MINLVVALATESRPLIEHFGLSQDPTVVGFRLFRGDGIRLIVTGLGRVSCAGGVAALGESGSGDGVSAWLNVGIAGHASLEVGLGVHAVSIRDAATGRNWYPPQVFDMPGRGEALCTVDNPETDYAGSWVYDMEASAFYAMAVRYATGELVQVYKVISDNREDGVDTVTRHGIREAIIDHLPFVEQAVTGLSRLADEVSATQPTLADFDRMLARWHFTVSQQHQLRSLLRRWEALFGEKSVWDSDINRCPSAKSVLAELEARIETVYGRPQSGR